jgi:hypothetical protein
LGRSFKGVIEMPEKLILSLTPLNALPEAGFSRFSRSLMSSARSVPQNFFGS